MDIRTELDMTANTINLAALIVHLWLPMLALCIGIVKTLNWLRVAVGRTQWFFKTGNEHPLEALGYVAAGLVFIGVGAVRIASVIGL